MINEFLVGLLTNATSELVFGSIRGLKNISDKKKTISSEFTKVYEDSLKETEKKFKNERWQKRLFAAGTFLFAALAILK